MGALHCEELFWSGIVVMGVAVFMILICCVVFSLSGRRLRKILEEEYGKPYT